ncbi:WxL domain-containing protein [Paenibacillus gallinarum]|uniref:Uncharacterized protein n=1 Tax=Paenibacillus gallinarum TaxID=2762232 RepID=A0ABR8T3W4_9BACL|nr:hypothetical protein [Paenibacillus gallinarum]MBD7970275.1 hypothetical protein [Paenibacillus gallinarum]
MNKKKFDWKKSLTITTAMSLLLGSLSLTIPQPKAEAADSRKVVSIEPYYPDNFTFSTNQGIKITLNDATSLIQKTLPTTALIQTPPNLKKYDTYYQGDVEYLDNNGTLWYGTKSTTVAKVLDGVKDYATRNKASSPAGSGQYFALMEDTSVLAWGTGESGGLGIGVKQTKLVPTEVVDPETGDPIKGIKKIFELANTSILLVGDGVTYLIGNDFKLTSLTTAKPLKLTQFPVFSSADEFHMEFLEGTVHSPEYTGSTTSNAAKRIFTIAGKKYTLTDLTKYDDRNAGGNEALKALSLIEVPADIDIDHVTRMANYTSKFGGISNSTGYLQLKDGSLDYWGTSPTNWEAPFNTSFAERRTIASSGVVSVFGTNKGSILYLKDNGYVYGLGSNSDFTLGLSGTSNLEDPVRISGTSNEVKDIKTFAVDNLTSSYATVFALKKDGTVITWKNSVFTTLSKKFSELYNIKNGIDGRSYAYAIDEDGVLGSFNSSGTFTPITGGTNLYPADFVPPATQPTTPVVAITSQDKFDRSVVGINYGADADLATKEYQINDGAWTAYTAPITVTQTGTVTIKARSTNTGDLTSEIGTLTLDNVPIDITSGHPLLDKVSGTEFKVSATFTGNAKVQVKVDNDAWQDHNVLNNLTLALGDHIVQVRVVNSRNEELISKSFNVTADEVAIPDVVTKPVISQTGLNDDFDLNIEVQYEPSEGVAWHSIDGGSWIKTTGVVTVSNSVHTIRAKVVSAGGTESEVAEFITTTVDPSVRAVNSEMVIDLGVSATGKQVYYKSDLADTWTLYSGPVVLTSGTHNIRVEVREQADGTVVYSGGPFVLVVPSGEPIIPEGPFENSTSEDVNININAGALMSRFEGADLSTIVIDSTKPYQQINSVSKALVDDYRGNGKGWQYSLKIEDFVSDPLNDNSTNTQSLVVSIPASSLAVDVSNSKTVSGPESELANVGKKVFTPNISQTLATAPAFEGMGSYEIPMDFTLSVPDRVKVNSAGEGSNYTVGGDTGLMAGTYRSVFTFTLVSGL